MTIKNWSQYFEIIYNYFLTTSYSKEFGATKIGLARLLGASQGKVQKWEKGQWPSAEDLETIADKFGFGYKWLITGKGDPFGETTPAASPTPAAPRPIPVLGLASCGVQGWEQTMPIAISTTLPVISESMVAVIASGDSMLPAGIAPGHICYCDPEQLPLAGDAVYLVRKDGLATIKAYVGESERGPEWTALRGWLPPNGGKQKDFLLELLSSQIASIAPVIYVRRRI